MGDFTRVFSQNRKIFARQCNKGYLMPGKNSGQCYLLVNKASIGTDGYDVQRDAFAAAVDSGCYSVAQTAAAGDGHSGNGDGADVVAC